MWPISVFLLGVFIVNQASADILVLPYNGRYIEEEFRDMPSTFGNTLPFTGLHGMVVYADFPFDGCQNLQPRPPAEDNQTGKWIIIIARCNCSFEQKVRNAQDQGYDAVIVHNVHSDSLEPMSAKNSTGIYIPSVFVAETTGAYLKDLAGNNQYYIIINSEIPFNINTHLLIPFVIVVALCFLVMVIFMLVKYLRDRRRRRRERLSSSALNKIPTCKFQKGDPYETCAICLDDYIEGEKLRVLPCAHAYHSKCIDPWLTKNRRVCPVCKRKVFAHDETPYPDSDSDTDSSDDTTPLLNSNNRTTLGGTFTVEPPNFLTRAIRSISQQENNEILTAADSHSINGEHEETGERSDYSTDSTTDEVDTVQPNRPTREPGTSNPNVDYFNGRNVHNV